MRKRNILICLPLLLAGCSIPPPEQPAAQVATALTPTPEVVSTEETPISEVNSTPTTASATPLPADASPTTVPGVTQATAASTPVAAPVIKSSAVVLPTPTNVAPTPTPIPRNARQEIANFGGQLEKALLKDECDRIASEVGKRSAFYEEAQYAAEKDKDSQTAAYCAAARASLGKVELAAKTKAEILKGERYHTQMADVEQMIQDANSTAP